jgi:hypothetical protein
MKFAIIGSALLVWSLLPAQAQKTPPRQLGFRGIHIGMTQDEVEAIVPDGWTCDDLFQTGIIWNCWDGYDGRGGAFSADYFGKSDNPTLISLSVDMTDMSFDALRRAFTTKYGAPLLRTATYHNGFGLKFSGVIAIWRSGDVRLELHERGFKLDEMRLTLYSVSKLGTLDRLRTRRALAAIEPAPKNNAITPATVDREAQASSWKTQEYCERGHFVWRHGTCHAQ